MDNSLPLNFLRRGIVLVHEIYTIYKATKSNLPMQFLMRAHEGFSRVAFLEHTVKKEHTNINSDINKECPTQRPLSYFNNHN